MLFNIWKEFLKQYAKSPVHMTKLKSGSCKPLSQRGQNHNFKHQRRVWYKGTIATHFSQAYYSRDILKNRLDN